MKLTKFVHSCLLVETPERVGLFDPGVFSWKSGLVDLDKIERIDRIIITHTHGDHFDPNFINAVLQKFPNAHIIGNKEVELALKDESIDAEFRGQETSCSIPFIAPHESLPFPGAKIPENTGYHFQDLLSHPGDSHTFNESREVLALPIIAPWGSTGDAVNLALKLKPKHIIPIHDWHYSPAGRAWLYKRLETTFKKAGIDFISPVDGQSFSL